MKKALMITTFFVCAYVKRVQKVKIFIKGKNGHFERLQMDDKL